MDSDFGLALIPSPLRPSKPTCSRTAAGNARTLRSRRLILDSFLRAVVRQELHLPSDRDSGAAAVLREKFSKARDRRLTSPITLKFAPYGHPGHRCGASLNHATHCHYVRLDRDATRSIGDDVDLIAVAQCMDGRHGQTDLGPEGSHDNLLAAGLLDGLDDAAVLPSVDESPIDRLLLRENVLKALDQDASTLFRDRG